MPARIEYKQQFGYFVISCIPKYIFCPVKGQFITEENKKLVDLVLNKPREKLFHAGQNIQQMASDNICKNSKRFIIRQFTPRRLKVFYRKY